MDPILSPSLLHTSTAITSTVRKCSTWITTWTKNVQIWIKFYIKEETWQNLQTYGWKIWPKVTCKWLVLFLAHRYFVFSRPSLFRKKFPQIVKINYELDFEFDSLQNNHCMDFIVEKSFKFEMRALLSIFFVVVYPSEWWWWWWNIWRMWVYVCDVYIHRKQNPVVEMNIRWLNIAPLNAPSWMVSYNIRCVFRLFLYFSKLPFAIY